MALTVRQVWEGMLTELSKVNAPSMLLQDFNYFLNKAVNQYVNKRYNIYDVNQQTTDDVSVLKASAILIPTPVNDTDRKLDKYKTGNAKLFGGTYEIELPKDYLHMLNCICIYRLNGNYKCYNNNDYVQFAAKRLTSDAWSIVVNDYYNRPLPERPYYYIHNYPKTDESNTVLYNAPIMSQNTLSSQTDSEGNVTRTLTFNSVSGNTNTTSLKENPGIRCEIRYGKDNSVFILEEVLIDYIKTPKVIRLTLEQVDLTQDTSETMEFPDYVCQEIINELVTLVMENTADPRLKTHPIVTQSIANPVQQLTQS